MSNTRNILVTGNGFDLYHGLKTNYMDFVHCVEGCFAKSKEDRSAFDVRMTELCNVNGFFRHFHFMTLDDPSWTNFEAEMENILQSLIHFQEVILENQKDIDFEPASFNVYGGNFTYSDLQIYKHFARIFEQIYDDPSGGLFKIRQQYITLEKLLNKKALIDEVRRELASFTEALDLYMTAVVGTQEVPQKKLVAELQPDYVVNLNYTHTATAYGIPEEKILYAKGKAGCTECNLVLGTPDETEEHMEWVYLRTYFQSLMKFVGLPDKDQLYPVDEAGTAIPVVTSVIGYSFPESDKGLIQDVFAASAKVVIYYADMEDYASKMIQLLKIFGKRTIMERLHGGEIAFEQI